MIAIPELLNAASVHFRLPDESLDELTARRVAILIAAGLESEDAATILSQTREYGQTGRADAGALLGALFLGLEIGLRAPVTEPEVY